jgi:hypothetical protein
VCDKEAIDFTNDRIKTLTTEKGKKGERETDQRIVMQSVVKRNQKNKENDAIYQRVTIKAGRKDNHDCTVLV